ncbi:MAG: hypothetical protein LBP50_09710, partial [Tannerella sp.]|nr:hypothetical protein [Tannerella sp.]
MKTYKIYETFLRGKKRLCPVPLLLVVGVLICCGCKDELSIPVPLAGTKWKLAGIVDMETGALRELEPKDCAGCYTLVFDSDHTASGC